MHLQIQANKRTIISWSQQIPQDIVKKQYIVKILYNSFPLLITNRPFLALMPTNEVKQSI